MPDKKKKYLGFFGFIIVLIAGLLFAFLNSSSNNHSSSLEKSEEVINNHQEEKKEEIKKEETKQEEKKEEKKEPEEKVEEERGFLYITMLVIFVLLAVINIYYSINTIRDLWNYNSDENKRDKKDNFVFLIIQISMLLCSFLIKGKKISIIIFVLEILFCVLRICYACYQNYKMRQQLSVGIIADIYKKEIEEGVKGIYGHINQTKK